VIEVILPAPLRRLAAIDGSVRLAVPAPVTQRRLLDALERAYPALRGTTRHHEDGRRRAYLRFFACGQDLSHQPPDAPLPTAVAAGAAPFLIVGALSGG